MRLSYLSTISRPEEGLVDRVVELLPPEAKRDVMDLVEHLLQQTRDEGRAEGLLDGRRETLSKQLRLKFGEIGADVEARVASAQADELELWAERILTAASLEELLAG